MGALSDYVAQEKLYLTREGKIVGSKHPEKLTLFMLPGGKIARELAVMHGLCDPLPTVQAEPQSPAASVATPAPPAMAPPRLSKAMKQAKASAPVEEPPKDGEQAIS